MFKKATQEVEAVEVIFRKWARHPITGKVIRPKNGAKALVIKLKKGSKSNLHKRAVSSETNLALAKD